MKLRLLCVYSFIHTPFNQNITLYRIHKNIHVNIKAHANEKAHEQHTKGRKKREKCYA